MEKKVEVIIGERIVKVMPHMLEDMLLHGATKVKKVIKEVPKELLTIPAKVDLLPEMKIEEKKEEAKPVREVRTEFKPKTRRKK